MRLTHVFGDNIVVAFRDILFAADYTDTFTATRSIRLHDVHVFVVADLSIAVPPLVVFWEDVGGRCDVEGLAMETAHALDVPPHKIFSADRPGAGEVI